MTLPRGHVVDGTAEWIKWWVDQRKRKLREHLSSSMAVNPLLLPLVFELHSLQNFEQLSELFVESHLMVGHSTGFGKLLDEKILPKVFNTTKLDAKFRRNNPPFGEPCFDEIDHIVRRGATQELLSLKASRWTIQLTMAVQLNSAFNDIVKKYGNTYRKIVVGVVYGREKGLTDKYDILRGINRGKEHAVTDLTDRVFVYAGKEFWSWLNGGEGETQKWVLEGIIKAVREKNLREDCEQLLGEFKKKISSQYRNFVASDGTIRWDALLREISG